MKRSLTDEQVEEARILYHGFGLKQVNLAERYHCTITTISLWVDPNEDRRHKKFHEGRPVRNIFIDQEKLHTIKALKAEGYNSLSIHKITGWEQKEVNRYYTMCPVDLSDVFSFE